MLRDIFFEVCKHLDNPRDLSALPCVSTNWMNYIQSPFHWRSKCKDLFSYNSESENYFRIYNQRIEAMSYLKSLKLVCHRKNADELGHFSQPLTATFINSHRTDDQAVFVFQTDMPLILLPYGNKQLVSYYETTIIDSGIHGYIGIGIAYGRYDYGLPGWSPGTWGYHGDDGLFFSECESGYPYGGLYSTGDIIGCGVVWESGNIFYTKNGKYLGNAGRRVLKDHDISILYPTVGINTYGESVRLNFGTKPFEFDILSYVSELENQGYDDVNASIYSPSEISYDFDWSKAWMKHNEFQPMIDRILDDPAGSAEDQDFLDFIREYLGIDDDLYTTADDLFQIVSNCYTSKKNIIQEDEEYLTLPENQRPRITLFQYIEMTRHIKILEEVTYDDLEWVLERLSALYQYITKDNVNLSLEEQKTKLIETLIDMCSEYKLAHLRIDTNYVKEVGDEKELLEKVIYKYKELLGEYTEPATKEQVIQLMEALIESVASKTKPPRDFIKRDIEETQFGPDEDYVEDEDYMEDETDDEDYMDEVSNEL
eukprot:TRINITY_DN3889_c0_g2_i1.p1 TRINITY_DN3889_c0_g2~~TRINITY_DN3889_c0_g2_i1.p1  ORF type:complete len:540 (-),score=115.83 TRINITY_DN3889_c0_g2_i1:427-2046(-)